ncbi:hypothetical protein [Oceanobacillus massiliensis]|uniref:hypothetical protein n=1 Tax=Oceanobacillus massiliensis TaxID=1465765 RepID=UPI000287FB0A|nr:hypothetical protein [Oceanobacillus massiliensis]
MDNMIKDLINKIEIPNDLHNQIKLGMKKAEREVSNRKNIAKGKIISIGLAAVAFVSICLGTAAYLSPGLLLFVSDNPIAASIFDRNPLEELIYKELHNHNYNTDVMDIHIEDSLFTISIGGPKGYFENVQHGVKKITETFLQNKGIESFHVEIVIGES